MKLLFMKNKLKTHLQLRKLGTCVYQLIPIDLWPVTSLAWPS